MREVEVSNYLKKLMTDIKNIRENIENSFEYEQILEKIEKINSLPYSDENAKEEKELYTLLSNMKDKVVESYLQKITDDDMKTILLSLSPDFMQSNHFIVGDALNPQNELELVINYCLKNVEDKDCEFHNGLIQNSDFTAAIDQSTLLLSSLIDKTNDEESIFNFIEKYTNIFSNYRKNKTKDYSDYFKVIESLFKSMKKSSNLKVKLISDYYVLKQLNKYSVSKLVTLLPLSSKDKLDFLINNHDLRMRLSQENYTKLLSSLINNEDDFNKVLNNERIAYSVDFSALLENINLNDGIIDFIINSNNVNLTSNLIKKMVEYYNGNFEILKRLVLNEKVLHSLNFYDILASDLLTRDQRFELLNNPLVEQVILKPIYNRDFQWLLLDKMPVDERIELIKNKKYLSIISSGYLQRFIASDEVSIDTATQLMLDKNIFYKMINEYHELYNNDINAKKGPFRHDKYECLMRLYNHNPILAKTLNFELLQDDILDCDFDFIEKISKYHYTALKFSNFFRNNSNDYIYFKNMLNIVNNSFYANDMNLDVLINRLLDICNIRDQNRLSSIRKKVSLDENLLTIERFKVLTEIGLRDSSLYYKGIVQTYRGYLKKERINPSLNLVPDINSVEDLDNYYSLRIKLCDSTFEECIDKRDLDGAINAYLNKYFNINIEEAREIVRLYGYSINSFFNNKKYEMQFKYINNLKKILSVTKIETIKESYNDKNIKALSFDESIYIDDSIKKIFSKEISDSVYKIDKENDVSYIDIPVLVDGKNVVKRVKVYEPGLEFKMLIHSTCAYGQMKLINNNYFDSWNKSSRKSNHGICCSLIANDNLGMADVKDVLFGFDSWGDNAITKGAPYDIYSYNDEFVIDESRCLKFMTSTDIINNTRHTHNEQVLERYELRHDRRTTDCQNIQPSYVIIYSDMSDEIKSKAVKCSNEMNIPIVYLDKEKIIKNEVRKIDNKIKSLCSPNTTIDEKIDLMEQILLSHENNRSGLRLSNSDLLDKYFPTNKIEFVFDNLIKTIQHEYENTHDILNYLNNSVRLMDILDKENNKFDITMEMTNRQNYIDIPVDKYKERIMQYISPYLARNNVPKIKAIIQNAQDNNLDLLLDNCLKKVDNITISDAIDDIVDKNLYVCSDKKHDMGYMERVILFSYLIGNKEFSFDNGKVDVQARNMLIECAKYHDCGREGLNCDNDIGVKSVAKMRELLSNRDYSIEEKKLMQAVVEYYNCNQTEESLKKICNKYLLNEKDYANVIYCISTYLDDATTLADGDFRIYDDGTYTLNDSANEFVYIAKLLNEEYKNIDRKQFEKICIEIYNNQLQSDVKQQNDSRRVTI